MGIYPQNSSEYDIILNGMITFADSFLSTVQQHAFENGSISEEFDRFGLRGVVDCRYTGYCVGARDLTWSYVAFQTAADARQRLINAEEESGLDFKGNWRFVEQNTGVPVADGWREIWGVGLVMEHFSLRAFQGIAKSLLVRAQGLLRKH